VLERTTLTRPIQTIQRLPFRVGHEGDAGAVVPDMLGVLEHPRYDGFIAHLGRLLSRSLRTSSVARRRSHRRSTLAAGLSPCALPRFDLAQPCPHTCHQWRKPGWWTAQPAPLTTGDANGGNSSPGWLGWSAPLNLGIRPRVPGVSDTVLTQNRSPLIMRSGMGTRRWSSTSRNFLKPN
jgi:hypothetical protein